MRRRWIDNKIAAGKRMKQNTAHKAKTKSIQKPEVIIIRKLTTERQYKRKGKTGQAMIYKTEPKPGGELR